MKEHLRNQRILESLAKQGFTVYEGKKVTFAEAEQLKTQVEIRAVELRAEKKQQVLEDMKNMLSNWSINEHRLTSFVEAVKKYSFMDILDDMLNGKELNKKQDSTIHELKRNLEFLAQKEIGAGTLLLPNEAEKLIAGVIVNFYEKQEYLVFTRELITEAENNTLTLIEIYQGKISTARIKELVTAEQAKVEVNSSNNDYDNFRADTNLEPELLGKDNRRILDDEDIT